ncbi:methyltransferase [Aeromicrobium sp. Leaf350]|uniref:DUF7059 domain-containing protein n=1 Tax=Aeromicrobium sp. Leaf350 TaxID=2876565 RepID=UPI001E51D27A|nr:methyltransferase [Aeromicrobium sp. Leaf350]
MSDLAPSSDVVDRLADALRTASFTAGSVHDLLGPLAHAALGRNETTPATRATADGSPLATLVRLFTIQRPVDRAAADQALPGLVDALAASGVLATSGGEVRALVDVRPYGDEVHDWWVVCDLTPGQDAMPVEVGPEHVLGISEASSSLARLVHRRPVGRALDLGTGCGVQALHLAQHATEVVATDVNDRALALARLTGRLNGVALDVRGGSLYEPVAGERFDVIASNPPFVVSPPDGDRLVYRETGFAGDDVVRRLVAGAADHLTEDGLCHLLAAWVHPTGADWQERLASWVAPTGLDAWVLEREEVDLPTYTEMWLADSGHRGRPGYTEAYDRWLTWFVEQGIESMGFGWITLRRAGRDVPSVRVEAWDGQVSGPVGPVVEQWAAALDVPGDVLDHAWVVAPDLVQHAWGPPGAEDPAVITVRLQDGLRRERRVDTVTAGLLSACDGDLTAGQVLGAIGTLLDLDPESLLAERRPEVSELVAEGFLRPA